MKRVAILTVLLMVGLSGASAQELVNNTGFEANTASWSANSCNITRITTQAHSGSASCRAYNRNAASDGLIQTFSAAQVAALVTSGSGQYRFSVYLKSGLGAVDGRIQMAVNSNWVDAATGPITDTGWSQVSGEVSLALTGIKSFQLAVNTVTTGPTEIFIDDCSLVRATVATPTITPNGGSHADSVEVTLACATAGNTIYYTTDGSPPTTGSTEYTGPFTLTSSATVKALAVLSGWLDSAEASASFTVTAMSQVLPVTITPTGGTFNDLTAVTLTCDTPDAIIYYTTDGATPSASSTLYGGAFNLGATASLKAIGVKSGMTDSPVASADFVIALASPTISPDGAEFIGSTEVTLACATPGATLYYTTDGSPPTTGSTLYGAPFVLSADSTVKVLAVKAGMADSAVTTAMFVELPDGSLVNGSFEYGSAGWTVSTTDANPTNYAITGSEGKTDGLKAVAFGGIINAAVGNTAFAQPLTTVVGAVYAIQFDHGAFGTLNRTQRLRAEALDGSTVLASMEVTDVNATSNFDPALVTFNTHTLTFTAASASTLLRFTDITTLVNANAADGVLDHVRILSATVATPTITPNGGAYEDEVEVTLACATAGSTIYYTTDGETPDSSSTEYTGPFTLVADANVQAIAVAGGLSDSAVVSADFTVTAVPQVSTPTITPDGGAFTASGEITLTCTTPGATIHYTIDGSTPTSGSTVYGGPFLLTANATVKAIAVKTGKSDSEVASADFTVAVVAPTFTPNGGESIGSVAVTLACATPGAAIRYTTDGSEPTAGSTLYSGPFTLTAGAVAAQTVKAIALKSGMADSAVASADFTVLPPHTMVNGSFENGTVGWTVSGVAYVVTTAEGKTDGNYALALGGSDLAGDTVIAQTLTTVPGAVYTIQFDHGAFNAGLNRPQTLLTEALDGATLLASVQHVTASSPTMGAAVFTTRTLTFTAASTTTVIRFSDLTSAFNSTSGDGVLDRVSVSSATVATPTLSPNGGTFGDVVEVSLACVTDGASIGYTTDGSPPTTSSPLYSGPITLTADASVKAIAWTSSGTLATSAEASADFIVAPVTQVATPTISPNGGAFAGSVEVTLACTTGDSEIHYTIDGSEPSSSSLLYTGPFTVAPDATSVVTVKAIGTKSGKTDSEVASADFTITVTVVTPTITPAGGSIAGLTMVTLACATPGASIRFTSDGSTPGTTAGSYVPYTGPFTMASGTVKAYAARTGDPNSAVATAVFSNTADEPWIEINVPGRVEAEDYRTGGEGVAYHDTDVVNTGHCYRGDRVDILLSEDPGGYGVGWIGAGEWLEYNVNVAADGLYDLVFRLASGQSGSKSITVQIDGGTIATASYALSDDWAVYHDTVVKSVSLTAGAHVLRLTFPLGGVNFNYLDVAAATTREDIPGRIEAEDFALGGQNVGYYDSTAAGNAGGAYRPSESVDIYASSDSGIGDYVGSVVAGEWLAYDVAVASTGKYALTFRVASAVAGTKTLRAQIDGITAATASFTHADGWETFHDVTVTGISLPAGDHELKILFDSSNINFNYIESDLFPNTVFSFK